MKWWKVLGIAAFAGVAAGGVLVARDERRRDAYTPDEVRDRLHARLTASIDRPGEPDDPTRPSRSPASVDPPVDQPTT